MLASSSKSVIVTGSPRSVSTASVGRITKSLRSLSVYFRGSDMIWFHPSVGLPELTL